MKTNVSSVEDKFNIFDKMSTKDIASIAGFCGLNLSFYDSKNKQIVGILYRIGCYENKEDMDNLWNKS